MMKPGAAFSEHIKTEKLPKRIRYTSSYGGFTKQASIRTFFLVFFSVGLFIVLFIKVFSLQIVSGSYYRLLSDKNRTRSMVMHAPRGIIFDRNKTPLVYNMPGFRKMEGKKATIVSREEALPLLAKGAKNIEIASLRQYPFKDVTAHVLGYIGQITEEELKKTAFASYLGTDFLGKAGIERYYESRLRGKDGRKLVEVDAGGTVVRTLGQTDAVSGEDITLTIDIDLQKATYEALRDIPKGVVIVQTPQGEVLTLVSKPSFDPNLFTLGKDYKVATDAAYRTVSDVLGDGKNQPLLNRAIGGVYPPASTFKLITAAAGLETKTVDERFTVEDTGVIKIGEFSFANWYFTQYGKTDGTVDVKKAIARSNDIYFYKLADMLGVDKLSAMAKAFGVGSKSGIDLGGEAAGLLPSKDWKKRVIGEPWYLGDNYHYGIGQGYLLTTPLQVSLWTQALANEGSLYEPHLLKNQKSKIKNQNFLRKEAVAIIREGMIQSCTRETGVAWPLYEFRIQNSELRIDNKNILAVKSSTSSAGLKDLENYRQIVVACKTGTAQHGDEHTLPHSWITLFAPAYDPEIVVTVLAESSGEGSNIAAPVAKKVLEAWFTKK